MAELVGEVVLLLVCRACGSAEPLDQILTASPACQHCGNSGVTELREAVVVRSPIAPAERYAWTPWLASRADAL